MERRTGPRFSHMRNVKYSNQDRVENVEDDEGFSDTGQNSHEAQCRKFEPGPSKKRIQNAISNNGQNIKRSKDDKSLYKQPTVEEINQLRETANLYHSNLFRLQIEEMLKELRVKEKLGDYVKSWLDEFNVFLSKLTSMTKKEDTDVLLFFKNPGSPKYPINIEKPNQKNIKFQFIAPYQRAFLIGSAAVDAWLVPDLVADVCVRIPSDCFHKEDYLNLRYDQKRAMYLSYIANEMIKMSFHSSNLSFRYMYNNPYKPCLEVVPNQKLGQQLIIRIHVAGDDESFKLNRFVPWNSNIRESFFSNTTDTNDEAKFATPNYNATVLFDLTAEANQILINETVGQHNNLRDGLILLKVWLRQRGQNTGFCSFSNYIMTLFVVYLFKQRKIHLTMSSYQVARTVWHALATSEWNVPNKGISLCTKSNQPNQPTMEQFYIHYDIVFVDATGYLNLCSNLSLDLYLQIKFESQRALDLLSNTKVNSFQALFMNKMSICGKFDHFLSVTNSKSLKSAMVCFGSKADRYSFAGIYYPQILKIICRVLRKGLGERVACIVPVETEISSWSISQLPAKQTIALRIGFVLNREAACEIIDKGPQANDPASADFREFWGQKAELRRFQDGSITEACVWASADEIPSMKRRIVWTIVEYLLGAHFKIEPTEFHYFATEFDIAYRLDQQLLVIDGQKSDAESTSLKVVKSFDEVAKKLRACDDLPLDITSVQGVSSIFHYCDPTPALSNATHYTHDNDIIFQAYKVYDGVIQLGLSGKWPNDLAAFRRVKAAFHLLIAAELRKKYKLVSKGCIDGVMVLHEGYLFRLEISHPKEIALMKKEKTEKGVIRYVDTPESLRVERNLSILPKVSSALHGLYQRYSSFGPTVMIAKRWLYSQLLDSYLWPDECTELLIASQFLTEGSFPNPVQPQCGFFRFLYMMSNFDFKKELVILNFNEEMSADEIAELEAKFSEERNSFPSLAIVTSFDNNKDSLWTRSAPSVEILCRVVNLAQHAVKITEPAFTGPHKIHRSQLFKPSMDGYDLIIHLNTDVIHMCPNIAMDRPPKELKKLDASVPAARFNPVEIGLQKLREAYSDFALFFYNPCCGEKIAVIWRRECFIDREFKPLNVNGCFVDNFGKVKCNVNQFIEEFKFILDGIYISFDSLVEKRIRN